MLKNFEHPRLAGGVPHPDEETDFTSVLRPLGFLYGSAARAACSGGNARAIAGDMLAFGSAELFVERAGQLHHAIGTVPEILAWAAPSPQVAERLDAQLMRLAEPRKPFAGLDASRKLLMGIVNVTPDSFSDGGEYIETDSAAQHATALVESGADIIDIGGESTRPGANPTDPEIELARVVPVINRLAGIDSVLSVDTRRASVMKAAIASGASIVNDVSALTDDPESLGVVAASGASVILMHMHGAPATMQDDPDYAHAPYQIYRYLQTRVAACVAAGIGLERISVDPGIGFGKTASHNAQLVASLAMLHGLGCVVTLGASRKMSAGNRKGGRDAGSIAATLAAVSQGIQLHRIHDVAAAREAIQTHLRIVGAG